MNITLASSVATTASDSAANTARAASPAADKPVSAPTPATANPGSPSPDQIAQAVGKANDAFAQKNQSLYASIETDKTTGIGVVKIMDKDSQQTVTQYPSKAIVEIAQALQSSSPVGHLIHEKA